MTAAGLAAGRHLGPNPLPINGKFPSPRLCVLLLPPSAPWVEQAAGLSFEAARFEHHSAPAEPPPPSVVTAPTSHSTHPKRHFCRPRSDFTAPRSHFAAPRS